MGVSRHPRTVPAPAGGRVGAGDGVTERLRADAP